MLTASIPCGLPHARAARAPADVARPLGQGAREHAFGGGKRAEGARVGASLVLNRLTNLTTTQTSSPPTTLQSYAYTLDEAGRRTQIAEADGTVRAYGYDGIDRLTSEAVTGPLTYTKTFAYDPVGNRTTQTTTGTGADTNSYAYDSRDRLVTESDNTTSYAYDLNGNVASKSGEASYSWDFENRLTSANMTASGATVAHEYDVDGNRVQTAVTSSASTSTTNLLVDTTGSLSQVVTETDANANLTALYVRVGDELLEVMRPGSTAGTWSTRFIHHDGLGSVRALTDETGTTIDTRGYEAFGTKNVEAGSDPLTYGFAGEPFEPTSTLACHRARWMDARIGRFAGMDLHPGNQNFPISLHVYLYAADNPSNRVDPTGLESPLQLLIGQEAHTVISNDYRERSPLTGKEIDTAISALVGVANANRASNLAYKVAFGVGWLARPDLASTDQHVIYEIKSVDDSAEGAFKMLAYLNLLSYLDPQTNWTAGTADQYTPLEEFTLPTSGITIEVNPPVLGVITYFVAPDFKAIAGAISIGAALGVATLVADTALAGSLAEMGLPN